MVYFSHLLMGVKMLELSHSSVSVYKSCPMRWKWRYQDGLKPKRTAPQLTLGQVLHKAFDLHFSNTPTHEILKFMTSRYNEEIPKASAEDHEQLILDHKTVLGMFLNYPNKNLNFDEIKSEMEFSTRIDNLRGVTFRGRVDGLVKQQGVWWLREVKTTGSSIKQFEQRAQTSSQATGYISSMHKVTGLAIEGCMYDCIRKPLLRKRVSEDSQAFADRIYLDYQDRSKQKTYFTRYYTYRTPVDLKRWEDDMVNIVRQIRKSQRHDCFYRNTDNCYMYNSECPYKKICFQETPDPLVMELYYEQ